MTSSCDAPFSFSPDLRLSLGAQDALNVALRFAFPGLFSQDDGPTRTVTFVPDELSGPSSGPARLSRLERWSASSPATSS